MKQNNNSSILKKIENPLLNPINCMMNITAAVLASTLVNNLRHNQMHATPKQNCLFFPFKYLCVMMCFWYNLYNYLCSRIDRLH